MTKEVRRGTRGAKQQGCVFALLILYLTIHLVDKKQNTSILVGLFTPVTWQTAVFRHKKTNTMLSVHTQIKLTVASGLLKDFFLNYFLCVSDGNYQFCCGNSSANIHFTNDNDIF